MNQYLKNLNKIEFVITNACTGRCKHCSEGEHTSCGEHIDPQTAADAVRKVAEKYDIKTVMTFGGEPLLYIDAVYAIMSTAKELNVSRRQVITNGYFSKDSRKIRDVAERLAECGVNDLRLSVDAFHQETIPLDIVKIFAQEAKKSGIPITLQPAWLQGRDADNIYNQRTREILDSFADMGFSVGDGNIIFHVFSSFQSSSNQRANSLFSRRLSGSFSGKERICSPTIVAGRLDKTKILSATEIASLISWVIKMAVFFSLRMIL